MEILFYFTLVASHLFLGFFFDVHNTCHFLVLQIIGYIGYSIFTYMISVQPLPQALLRRVPKNKLNKGEEAIMRRFHEIAGQVIIYLNVELRQALVGYIKTIKCLNKLHDDLNPNS